uniref:Uncharacterized protein n=1 Tax=Rhizophora mucronata TaxID=61149 RepID=A0A2P2QQ68_RHIMU
MCAVYFLLKKCNCNILTPNGPILYVHITYHHANITNIRNILNLSYGNILCGKRILLYHDMSHCFCCFSQISNILDRHHPSEVSLPFLIIEIFARRFLRF